MTTAFRPILLPLLTLLALSPLTAHANSPISYNGEVTPIPPDAYQWTTDNITIANQIDGSLSLTTHNQISADSLTVASNVSTYGTLNMEGDLASISVDGTSVFGLFGDANINISNLATFQTKHLDIATESSSASSAYFHNATLITDTLNAGTRGRAYLSLAGGAKLSSHHALITSLQPRFSNIVLHGTDTRWDFLENPGSPDNDLTIGGSGNGGLTLSEGATLRFDNQIGDIHLSTHGGNAYLGLLNGHLFMNGRSIYQNGGISTINMNSNATLQDANNIQLEEGFTQDSGTLIPAGYTSPDWAFRPLTLSQTTIANDYTQTTSNARIQIDIEKPDTSNFLRFRKLQVEGTATLLGGLDIQNPSDHTIAPGSYIDILKAAQIVGQFNQADINTFSLPDNNNLPHAIAVLYLDTIGTPATDTVRLLATLAGDTNGDGTVGPADLQALKDNWLSTDTNWQAGDTDYDNTVGPQDLARLKTNWLQSIPGGIFNADPNNPTGGAGIPEPTSLSLLALATLPLLARRR